jgi:hypothetical protein
MNIYWFGRHTDKDLGYISDLLEDSGFYGWLLPYAAGVADPFIRIARSLKIDQKLKYLVAVRPHTISPQYLLAISQSLDLIEEDRVRINFVPGLNLSKEDELFGGILSEVTDSSSFFDRKKYLCSYIEQFNNLKGKKPYVYISGSSDDACPNLDNLGDATIVRYGSLLEGNVDPSDKTKIIFFPVVDIKSFKETLNDIKEKGYNNVMIHVHGDKLFDLALEVFKEVKNISRNEGLGGW